MPDTKRTRAAILALFADNVTGQISAQDLRDFVVTVMPEDFQFADDFWSQPLPAFLTTDKSGMGWIEYSHTAGQAIAFGNALYKTSTGLLKLANASASAENPVVGLALDSYASNDTDVQILRRGLLLNTAFSVRWSEQLGRPVYLQSAPGSYSVTITTNSVVVLGYVEDYGYLRFDPPEWAVVRGQ